MKQFLPLFIFIIFLLSSCGSSSPKENPKEAPTASTTINSTATATEQLPSIPVAILQKLFDNCDYVDYLFYQTNFSMSMSNKGSIQQTLTHVSQDVPRLNNSCKSIGRVFYEINGATEIEAEIFFSEQCKYLVFMKNNKKLYANNLTPDGIKHFENVFRHAAAAGKSQ